MTTTAYVREMPNPTQRWFASLTPQTLVSLRDGRKGKFQGFTEVRGAKCATLVVRSGIHDMPLTFDLSEIEVPSSIRRR